MTTEEIAMTEDLERCTFLPGSTAKRFVRDMTRRSHGTSLRPLTDKQARYLRLLHHQYRRQIACHVCDESCQPANTGRVRSSLAGRGLVRRETGSIPGSRCSGETNGPALMLAVRAEAESSAEHHQEKQPKKANSSHPARVTEKVTEAEREKLDAQDVIDEHIVERSMED